MTMVAMTTVAVTTVAVTMVAVTTVTMTKLQLTFSNVNQQMVYVNSVKNRNFTILCLVNLLQHVNKSKLTYRMSITGLKTNAGRISAYDTIFTCSVGASPDSLDSPDSVA